MKLTTEILWGFGPCYPPTSYFSEDWEGTLIEVLQDERIWARDRIWVFSKAAPENTCREFARWCALQVIDKWDAPDFVREYLKTGNEELRTYARAAAAKGYGISPRDAMWYATSVSARSAAYGAATAYAETEDDNGARDTLRYHQLDKAIELVNEYK